MRPSQQVTLLSNRPPCIWCRQAVETVKDRSPIGQGRAHMALGVVLGQLASALGLPQKNRADYHDEALLALQQAVACDPADVDILYNLALVQVSAHMAILLLLSFALWSCLQYCNAACVHVDWPCCCRGVLNKPLDATQTGNIAGYDSSSSLACDQLLCFLPYCFQWPHSRRGHSAAF